MIYLDSSVLLASIFGEQRSPSNVVWDQELTSSRLLAYGERAKARLDRVDFVELSEPALARALAPFPVALRTLNALHLATIDFLRKTGAVIELASYDRRLLSAAQALGMPLAAI